MAFLIETLTFLAIVRTALAAGVIKTFNNYSPTVYYDNLRCENGDPCAATWGATWSDSSAKGYAKCENVNTSIQKPYNYYKSNQFVAIDLSLFATAEDFQKFCGKKVRVTKPDGTEYKSAGGDLFVWDSCLDCVTMPRVDFSAPDLLAMTGLKADKCGKGEPAFKIEILDESVVEYGGHPPDAPGGVDTFKGADVGGGASCAAAGGNTATTLAAGGTSVGAVASTGASTGGAGTTKAAALGSSASSSTPLALSVASSAAESSVGASLAVPSPAVGLATVPAVQPAQSFVADSAIESSVDTATALPVSTGVATIASDGSGPTSDASSVASTAEGGYQGWRGSWTRY